MDDVGHTGSDISVLANGTSAGAHAAHVIAVCDTGSVYDLWVGLILPSVAIALGLLGNVICLVVLLQDQYPGPTFYSLRLLAASDTWLLISAFVSQVLPMSCYTHGQADGMCYYGEALRIYAWPCVTIGQLTTTWLTLLISAERYVAICHPLHARKWCTIRKIKVVSLITVIVAVLYNIPRFFEFYLYVEDTCYGKTKLEINQTSLRGNEVYRYLYNTVLHGILQFIIPMATLAFLNLQMVRVMTSARRDWGSLNRKRRRELRIGVIPLIIVILFLFVSIQSFITFILDAFILALDITWLQRYTAFVNFLVILNSALNFIIFYVFGSRFRLLLFRTTHCKFGARGTGLKRQGAQHLSRGRTQMQTTAPMTETDFVMETQASRRQSEGTDEDIMRNFVLEKRNNHRQSRVTDDDFLKNFLSVPPGHASRRTSAAWSEYSDNSDDTVPRYALHCSLVIEAQGQISPAHML